MGAYSRNKGNAAERDLAKFLRQWWPSACRAVRTGSSAAPDPGDIANVPFIVSCKSVAAATAPSLWATWWAELDAMRADDPVALAFVVEKRAGHADCSMWWAHLWLSDLVALHTGRGAESNDRTPVRIQLEHLVELLVASGYARTAA